MRFRKPNLPPGWRIKITTDPVYIFIVHLRDPENRSSGLGHCADTKWGVNRAIRRLEAMAWFEHENRNQP